MCHFVCRLIFARAKACLARLQRLTPLATTGFITRSDGEGDVFVHQSDLHSEGFRSLREGEAVVLVKWEASPSRRLSGGEPRRHCGE